MSLDSKVITKNNNEKSVYTIYQTFQNNFQSIEIFFKRLSPLAKNEDETIVKDLINYVEESMIEVLGSEKYNEFKARTKEKKAEKIPFNTEESKKLAKKLLKMPLLPSKNYETIARSSFIMLNNYFEYLFSDLLTYYFKLNPLLFDKKVSFSIGELKRYPSVDDACEDIIYKEVESMLLDLNFEELKQHFKNKLGIDLGEDVITWEAINEIRERRHIIIHNNSIVNKKYLVRTKNPFDLKYDSQVSIDNAYFENSLRELKLAGSIILFNCWGNWDKSNATLAISEIMDLSFEHLKLKEYVFVKKLCIYAEKNIKPRNDDEDNYMHRIRYNHCIALKRLNEQEVLDKKLIEMKIGALSPIFKIAHFVLKGEFQPAIDLFKKAMVVDELTIDKYNEWPLFEDLRNETGFNEQAIAALSD